MRFVQCFWFGKGLILCQNRSFSIFPTSNRCWQPLLPRHYVRLLECTCNRITKLIWKCGDINLDAATDHCAPTRVKTLFPCVRLLCEIERKQITNRCLSIQQHKWILIPRIIINYLKLSSICLARIFKKRFLRSTTWLLTTYNDIQKYIIFVVICKIDYTFYTFLNTSKQSRFIEFFERFKKSLANRAIGVPLSIVAIERRIEREREKKMAVFLEHTRK